jgi:hypothetical protein
MNFTTTRCEMVGLIKKTVLLLLAVLLTANSAFSAGSWADLTYRKGYLNGALQRPYGLEKTFTADASNGSVPEVTISEVSGLLAGIDVEFGSPAPNSVTVAVKTVGGITLFTSSALTASGRVEIDPHISFAGGLKLLVTTNTTNSAIATIVPLVY